MTNKTKLILLATLLLAALLLPSVVRAERVDTPGGRTEIERLIERMTDAEPVQRSQEHRTNESYPNPSYPNPDNPAETDIHWFRVWECWEGWEDCGQEPPRR